MKRFFLLAMGLLAGCGQEQLAGKTTTTGNGLQAFDSAGRLLHGARAHVARAWDSAAAVPVGARWLFSDADGVIDMGDLPWEIVQIEDSSGRRGKWLRLGPDDPLPARVRLDSLRELQLEWPQAAHSLGARLVLEGTFATASFDDSGKLVLGAVPPGRHPVRIVAANHNLSEGILATPGPGVSGSSDLDLVVDGKVAPLLVDDFESGFPLLSIRRVWPGTRRWHLFAKYATLIRPLATDSIGIQAALRSDSARGSHILSLRHSADTGYVVLQADFGSRNLARRNHVCFLWRSDRRVKVELIHVADDTSEAGFSTYVRPSSVWADTCVAFSALGAQPQNPDSLRTWKAFAPKVAKLQMLATSGSTYLDLDDIVFDRD